MSAERPWPPPTRNRSPLFAFPTIQRLGFSVLPIQSLSSRSLPALLSLLLHLLRPREVVRVQDSHLPVDGLLRTQPSGRGRRFHPSAASLWCATSPCRPKMAALRFQLHVRSFDRFYKDPARFVFGARPPVLLTPSDLLLYIFYACRMLWAGRDSEQRRDIAGAQSRLIRSIRLLATPPCVVLIMTAELE